MISYQLAEKLRDAGFPQKKNENARGREKYMAYIPTLSELIEVCGDSFNSLILERDGSWSVFQFAREEIYTGKTPEEAVARLWLALNEDD